MKNNRTPFGLPAKISLLLKYTKKITYCLLNTLFCSLVIKLLEMFVYLASSTFEPPFLFLV